MSGCWWVLRISCSTCTAEKWEKVEGRNAAQSSQGEDEELREGSVLGTASVKGEQQETGGKGDEGGCDSCMVSEMMVLGPPVGVWGRLLSHALEITAGR